MPVSVLKPASPLRDPSNLSQIACGRIQLSNRLSLFCLVCRYSTLQKGITFSQTFNFWPSSCPLPSTWSSPYKLICLGSPSGRVVGLCTQHRPRSADDPPSGTWSCPIHSPRYLLVPSLPTQQSACTSPCNQMKQIPYFLRRSDS